MFIIFLIPSLEELTSEEYFSFQHQLIFKQKEKNFKKGEIVWLNSVKLRQCGELILRMKGLVIDP